MSDTENLILNIDKNNDAKCMSMTYKFVVLCLLTISAFFSSFAYYSLEIDSSDIKSLLSDISSKLVVNNTY